MGEAILARRGGGGSNIKSVQSGVLEITSGTEIDITINEVDTSVSVPFIVVRKKSGSSNAKNTNWFTAELVNGTTLRLKRGLSNNVIEVRWAVVSFNNVKSHQVGEVNITASSAIEREIIINSVDINKSMLVMTVRSTATSTITPESSLGYNLKDATTISYYDNYNSPAWFRYNVIEFK